MDEATRVEAEALISYQFNDPTILSRALTHASIADDRLLSNERMEFLGDAVLGLVICEFVYEQFPDRLEGDLTKIKSAAVSRRTCAQVARDIGLENLLKLGKGMGNHTDLPVSLAAAVFESLTAAIYMDGGIDAARHFILTHLAPVVEEAARSGHQHNFKSILQQYAQRQFGQSASYVLLDENGPDHAKCFEICVEVGDRRFPSSWAGSKKESEQMAALNALLELGVVIEDEDSDSVYVDEAVMED